MELVFWEMLGFVGLGSLAATEAATRAHKYMYDTNNQYRAIEDSNTGSAQDQADAYNF